MPLDDPLNNHVLLDYIQKLPDFKKSLPSGVPISVLTSHQITTSAALLQLAAEIGPYIAILAIQADIIDDWTQDTIDQLTYYAKKHGFILWEASRILNSTVNFMGRLSPSQATLMALAYLTKKKYTNGPMKAGEWAGLATAWAPGVPVDHQENDLLIPSIRQAAREAVYATAKTIQTEISAEKNEVSQDEVTNVQLSPPTSNGWHEFSQENMGSALRKSSTISVTETLTMQPHVQPDDGIPSPPLLSRGLVLCLPYVKESAFTFEYLQSTIAAACANPDFVFGFISGDPYFTSHRANNLRDLIRGDDLEVDQQKALEPRSVTNLAPHFLNLEHDITLISMIPAELSYLYDMEVLQAPKEDPPKDSRPPSVIKLFTVMERAVAMRENNRKHQEAHNQTSEQTGPKMFHIPSIVLP